MSGSFSEGGRQQTFPENSGGRCDHRLEGVTIHHPGRLSDGPCRLWVCWLCVSENVLTTYSTESIKRFGWVWRYMCMWADLMCAEGVFMGQWFIQSTVGPIISWGLAQSSSESPLPPGHTQASLGPERALEHRLTVGPDWWAGQVLFIPPAAPFQTSTPFI